MWRRRLQQQLQVLGGEAIQGEQAALGQRWLDGSWTGSACRPRSGAG
jgi:hypothetical protein